jgi:predicted nucleic acid-binding protein
MTPILFADSNVLIEALLIPQSAAYAIAELVAQGVFDLAISNRDSPSQD